MKNLAIMSTAAMRGGGVGTWPFGLDRENAAAALRYLADQLDAKAAMPVSVVQITTAKGDDFAEYALTVTFCAKRDEPSPGAAKPVAGGEAA